MIKLKICKGSCEIKQEGTVEEILTDLRSLDYCRDTILHKLKRENLEYMKKKYPSMTEEEHSKLLDTIFNSVLESITVVGGVEDDKTRN